MHRASLAALTLGLLSACQTTARPASPQSPAESGTYGESPDVGGECRPDIGPGGVLKIYPAQTGAGVQSVRIIKIPNHQGKGAVTLGGSKDTKKLALMTEYTLTVDFGKGNAELNDGKNKTTIEVPVASLPFKLVGDGHRFLLVDNDAGAVRERESDNVFDKASLLLVFGDTGSGGTYVATLSITD